MKADLAHDTSEVSRTSKFDFSSPVCKSVELVLRRDALLLGNCFQYCSSTLVVLTESCNQSHDSEVLLNYVTTFFRSAKGPK